jgi:hypothetical protein
MSQTKDTMNCDDYQQALAATPDFEDESGHVQGCAECQAFNHEMLALDGRIRAAMELSVPPLRMPELPDLDVENVVSLPARRRLLTPSWFAIAATVALAAFIGIRTLGPAAPQQSLESQVLAHVDHEPTALLPSNTPVDDDKLQRVVPRNIATMNHDAGLITFAATCPINGNEIPHLVLQGKTGPITILLLPDEKIDESKILEGDNVHGVIVPVGDGSVAIIGTRDESLDEVQQNVVNSVAWGI